MTAPPARARKVFLVATEESGDRLGAALMRALRERADVRFAGVGGRQMAAQGLASLFPIDDLAIMGFFAIPARLPMILRRIRAAADAVIADRPDVLVIIDSPDFTHRVARRVRAAAPAIPIVDYVSPSVWVWRPGRARAMRDYVDHILALLPFEPEVHRQLGGPPCTYVGHPMLEQVAQLRPGAQDAARRDRDPPLILVLPGSRSGEITRHLGVFGETLAILTRSHGPLEPVLPTVPHLLERVKTETAAWTVRPRIVVEPADKWAAFRTARAALAASGTVTLELAVATVPTVVAYKVPLVEEAIVRALARHHPVLRTRTIVLANLVLGEMIMPEFLQWQVRPELLAGALLPLLGDTAERARQLAAFARLDAVMQVGAWQPSQKGADMVLDIAARGRPGVR